MCNLQSNIIIKTISLPRYSEIEFQVGQSTEIIELINPTQIGRLVIRITKEAHLRLKQGLTTVSHEYQDNEIQIESDFEDDLIRASLFIRWSLDPEKDPSSLIQCSPT